MRSAVSLFHLALVLSVLIPCLSVSGGHNEVSATIEVPPEAGSAISPVNATVITIEGAFTVTAKNGADYLIPLSGDLSLSSGEWPAEVGPSSFSNLVQGQRYEFRINVTVPAGSPAPKTGAYSIRLTLTNLLGSTSVEEAFIVKVDPPDPVHENGGGFLPRFDGSFPWGMLIFVLGLLLFLMLGVIWAVRNLEIVREIDGGRRIMLREKRSGRLLKGRVPPTP